MKRVLNIIIILQLMAIWFFGLLLTSIPEAKMSEATAQAYKRGYHAGYAGGYKHGTEGLTFCIDRILRSSGKPSCEMTIMWFFGAPFCMWLIMSVVCRLMDKTHTIWWHMTTGWAEALW